MKYFVSGIFLLALNICSAQKSNHIVSVTAITEVFGDGQKLTAAAVEFDTAIKKESISVYSFLIEGRTITKIYTNNTPKKTLDEKNGKYVIIELSSKDANAATFSQQGFHSEVKQAVVSVKQTGSVKTINGETYSPSGETIKSIKQINLIVDDFKQFEFKDQQTGVTIKYNLFIPKNYNKNKKYPLVLFIHDAGVLSSDIKTTLVQGLGAIIWASPEEQLKHECFVLAPQFDQQNPAGEDEKAATVRDAIVHLLKNLTNEYSIDGKRLYTTGQSMGCMASIAMNIKYPNLFAASFLVAGQWDATKVLPMVNDKLWIVVSEGDLRAYPGMNAITEELEKNGAKVSRAVWSGKSSPFEFTTNANKMITENSNIKYTMLKKGTVVPDGMRDDSGSNHICTWRIAYTIESIRDWLFQQEKK